GAKAGRPRAQMSRTSTEKAPPALQSIRDQRVTGGPGEKGEHLAFDGRAARALDRSLRLMDGDRALVLARPQLGVERELVAAVHGRHECATITVEAVVHPRLGMRDAGVEILTTKIDGQHPSAHEIALCPGQAAA